MREYKLKGIFEDRRKLFTLSLVPGQKVYSEQVVNGKWREWIPQKSKLAAGIKNGLSQIGIKPGSKVLYLGASTGTTCSHVSDMLGKEGELYALDFAPRTQRELVFLAETRSNMTCLLEDAAQPKKYEHKVPYVDVVFQDIAQRDQAGIFIKNCEVFLKSGGFGILAVKAKSIDSKKRPKAIFAEVRETLEKSGLVIVDSRTLEPYEKDHYMFVIKKR
ncbi:MAG: fibrillarin-like rRNA/tRNA 2'-O-methyltransferase [Candidatus Woesearchaeota archaeon]